MHVMATVYQTQVITNKITVTFLWCNKHTIYQTISIFRVERISLEIHNKNLMHAWLISACYLCLKWLIYNFLCGYFVLSEIYIYICLDNNFHVFRYKANYVVLSCIIFHYKLGNLIIRTKILGHKNGLQERLKTELQFITIESSV